MTGSTIRDFALSIGYENCGIIPITAMDGYTEKVADRINRFPEIREKSAWLLEFENLKEKFPWAKSILICASWFGHYRIPDNMKNHIGAYYLMDSRHNFYAKEYERSIALETYLKEKGVRVETERNFGNTGLRWAAMKAGIGRIRKNNFFYTEKGSLIHLESFILDENLAYIEECNLKPCPEGCSLCIKNCPTKSLSEPYVMNRNTCICALTTDKELDLKGHPLSSAMGSWIYGCDACQTACPFNKSSWKGVEAFPGLEGFCKDLSLVKMVEADYAFLENVVQPKLWYFSKECLWRYKTNALNAMLNEFKPEYYETIKLAQLDTYEPVRRQATWVLECLKKQETGKR